MLIIVIKMLMESKTVAHNCNMNFQRRLEYNRIIALSIMNLEDFQCLLKVAAAVCSNTQEKEGRKTIWVTLRLEAPRSLLISEFHSITISETVG
jgi:hypothetical protein